MTKYDMAPSTLEIDVSASTDATDIHGMTGLQLMAKSANPEIVRIILGKGTLTYTDTGALVMDTGQKLIPLLPPNAAGVEYNNEIATRLLKEAEQMQAKAEQMIEEAYKMPNYEDVRRIRNEAMLMHGRGSEMSIEAAIRFSAALEQEAKQEIDLRVAIAGFDGMTGLERIAQEAMTPEQREADNLKRSRKAMIRSNPQPLLPEVKANKKGRIRRGKREPALEPGVTMRDNTIFGGVSKQDGTLIFTTQADAEGDDGKNLAMSFNEAAAYVAEMNEKNAFGHNDWHLATPDEMRVIIRNRKEGALKDTFNLTRPQDVDVDSPNNNGAIGTYLTSRVEEDGTVWGVRAVDGKPIAYLDDDKLSIRIVRTVNADGTQPGITSKTKDTQIQEPSAEPDAIVKQLRAKELTSAELDAIAEELQNNNRFIAEVEADIYADSLQKKDALKEMELSNRELIQTAVAPYCKVDGSTLDVELLAKSPLFAKIIALPGMAEEFAAARTMALDQAAVQFEAVNSSKAKKHHPSQKFFG